MSGGGGDDRKGTSKDQAKGQCAIGLLSVNPQAVHGRQCVPNGPAGDVPHSMLLLYQSEPQEGDGWGSLTVLILTGNALASTPSTRKKNNYDYNDGDEEETKKQKEKKREKKQRKQRNKKSLPTVNFHGQERLWPHTFSLSLVSNSFHVRQNTQYFC